MEYELAKRRWNSKESKGVVGNTGARSGLTGDKEFKV
jgi:hypothetical protein